MAVYYYLGKNFKGEILRGIYESQEETEIVELLKKKGFYPIAVRKHPFYSFLYILGDIPFDKKYEELAFFCRQMAGMLQVGMPVVDCLSLLCNQFSRASLVKTLKKVIKDLNRGFTLSEAFKNQPAIFPDILVYAVETGEISGRLEEILKKLAVYFETIAKYRQRYKSSLVYPAFLGLVSLAVYYFLSNTLMPLYTDMFEQAGIHLPLPTRIFIAVAANFNKLALLMIFVFISILGLRHWLMQDPKIAYKVDKFLLNLPILGLLIKHNNTANFCKILAILLSSGIPLIKAIELAQKNMSNAVFKRDLQLAKENMEKGEALVNSLRSSAFPTFMLRMLQLGIESGKLEEMLFKIADFYDEEISTLQQRILALIEPLAILFMSIVIGFAVISAVLPMFRLYTVF